MVKVIAPAVVTGVLSSTDPEAIDKIAP